VSKAQGQHDLDLDEDLFDFPEVSYEPDETVQEEDLDEVFASFREASKEEELLDVPVAESVPAREPVESARPAVLAVEPPAPRQSGSTPAPAHFPTPVDAPALPAPQARAPGKASPQLKLSRSVVGIALAMTVLNSVLAVVLLRKPSQTSGQHAIDAVDQPIASTAHAAPVQTHERAPVLPDPERVQTSHSHPTLERARERIARGEYASARQGVYGLLAIIDRLDDPRRSALEADCQFLIAQSLHLEALARMGEAR